MIAAAISAATGRLWIDPADVEAMLNQTGAPPENEEMLSDYQPGADEPGTGLLSGFDLHPEELEGP